MPDSEARTWCATPENEASGADHVQERKCPPSVTLTRPCAISTVRVVARRVDEALGRQRDEVDEKADGGENFEAERRMLLDDGAGGRAPACAWKTTASAASVPPSAAGTTSTRKARRGALGAGLGEAEGQFGRHRGLDPVVDGDAHLRGVRGSRGALRSKVNARAYFRVNRRAEKNPHVARLRRLTHKHIFI